MAVTLEGCNSATDPSNCTERRGGLFDDAASSSWLQRGIFELPIGVEKAWGYAGNGSYGMEKLSLIEGDGNSFAVSDGIVSAYATKDFFLGSLGLTQYNLYAGDFNSTPIPSILASLRSAGEISTLSWAYTAGAQYPSVGARNGSLTLGGYDRSRFETNNLTIPILDNPVRDLVVGLQAITSGSQNLLMESTLIILDSTIGQLWLSEEACTRFEEVFGLTWDSATNLYFVNDTAHARLLQENPMITFTIAANVTDTEIVNINMPYSAFDLQADWPLSSGGSEKYFPLRRASEPSLYVLGRPFFQEAYVIVDYERGNFTVAQAKFPAADVGPDLVEITAQSSDPNRGRLSAGAIAGVVVAVSVLAVVGATYVWWRRRKLRSRSDASEASTADENGGSYLLKAELSGQSVGGYATAGTKSELAADESLLSSPTHTASTDMHNPSGASELAENRQILEKDGQAACNPVRSELHGGDPPRAELQGSTKHPSSGVYELP